MCLQHPCYESLNRFAASKPARIFFGVILVISVAFGCYRLLQASNDLQASKNAKLLMIPEKKDNLIHYNPLDTSNYKQITSEIDKFYDMYEKKNENLVRCNDDTVTSERSCALKLEQFGICSPQKYYGYDKGTPCVFLKIKKALDWIPNYINSSNIPENFPDEIKERIKYGSNSRKKAVWFSCEGENPADIENIGPISYFPSSSIPSYYFPWKGQEDYLEPIIAFHFERPSRGIVIFVKCTMWTQDLQETISFRLFVE